MVAKKSKKQDTNGQSGVIYARYSSHAQRDCSIEQQVEQCTAHAKRLGIEIKQIYSDRAISGKTDQRPAFQKMLKDAEKGGFRYVIAWKSNRIGRNMLQAMVNEERLSEMGVRCLYVGEDFDDNAAGRFALRNMMNVNQFYSENMAEDIMRGLMDNAEKCFVNSRPPYGYEKGPDHKYKVVPDQAEVVREVFRQFLAGRQLTEIASNLNRRNIRTRNGNLWNKGSFHRRLSNEIYTGVYKYREIRTEGGVPAIIDKDTFEEAQRRMKTKKQPSGKRTGRGADYLLTGKLYCGSCKELMTGYSGKSLNGEPSQYHYYHCKGHRYHGTCDRKPIRKELVEEAVISAIDEFMAEPHVVDFIIAGFKKVAAELEQNATLKAMEAELSGTKKSINNILDAIEEGIFTPSTKDRLLELEDRQAELEKAIQIEKVTNSMSTDPDRLRYMLEENHRKRAEDPEYITELIQTFVQAVYLYDDYILIFFNYSPDDGKPYKVDLADIQQGEKYVYGKQNPTIFSSQISSIWELFLIIII